MNYINPMNNMNALNAQLNFPCKAIIAKTSINQIKDSTFILSVLQVFSGINCIKNWYNILDKNKMYIMNNSNFSITKELYCLLYFIYTNQIPEASNLILHYFNKINSSQNNKFEYEPYYFFYYLLVFLHTENNSPLNPNYDFNQLTNQNIYNKMNNTYMYNVFCTFFKQTQNSIISNFFSNIMKKEKTCSNNCKNTYYYIFKNIIKFDVDNYRNYRDQTYPQKTCMNLNMDECFTCYIGGYDCKQKCNFCGGYSTNIYTSFAVPAKVLIITFKRKTHKYHCDIDFEFKLNITKYIAKEHLVGINSNTNYNLIACISLNSNNQYFADICIFNKWYRFLNGQIVMSNKIQNDIHVFEPQILIYELE
jgi:hypothetical protein